MHVGMTSRLHSLSLSRARLYLLGFSLRSHVIVQKINAHSTFQSSVGTAIEKKDNRKVQGVPQSQTAINT